MRRADGQAGRRADNPAESPVRPSDRPTVELPRSGRILAIDWGEKRIGLALSDPTQTLAQPLATLTRRAGRRLPMRALRDQVDEHHPTGIVVGLPITPDGTEGSAAAAARAMAGEVARATSLPVDLVDERFTSSRARQAITEMGGKTRGREAEVDALAATVLLQGFLDRRRS